MALFNFQNVSRCDTCQAQCHNVIEDVTRTPSRTILIEANQFNRSIAADEEDIKVNVWAAAAPPTSHSTSQKYPIDMLVVEKSDALRSGKIVLDKKLNIETIKSYGEEDEEEEDDDKDYDVANADESNDDDDYTTSSTQL